MICECNGLCILFESYIKNNNFEISTYDKDYFANMRKLIDTNIYKIKMIHENVIYKKEYANNTTYKNILCCYDKIIQVKNYIRKYKENNNEYNKYPFRKSKQYDYGFALIDGMYSIINIYYNYIVNYEKKTSPLNT